jgi:hypothetical protein
MPNGREGLPSPARATRSPPWSPRHNRGLGIRAVTPSSA